VNSKDSSFLKVGHDADAESSDPAEVQPDFVDFYRSVSDLVADQKLVDLLVPDVDYDGHQQGFDVKKLSENARL
jgi:hypothetical protein